MNLVCTYIAVGWGQRARLIFSQDNGRKTIECFLMRSLFLLPENVQNDYQSSDFKTELCSSEVSSNPMS
jgi:hypothetical protein